MDRSTPGLAVHHHLPEFAQVHVHCISDAIQPFHPEHFSPSQTLVLYNLVLFPDQSTEINSKKYHCLANG